MADFFGLNNRNDEKIVAGLVKSEKARKKIRANERFLREQESSPAREDLAFDLKQRAQNKELQELRKTQRLAQFADSRAGRAVEQSRKVGFETGRAVAVGMQHQQPSFSREQEMLGEMFGQGEKIWGQNQEPVRLNNDLNPSRSDPYDETSSMFGAGRNGERSGLF
ncbi:MAG: hypothetical protein DRP42_07115 [Tenericutes bacterium]|nr:MAG: hypothetical protein DRP42_07115 [Mycoplasmatota bacterium]